MKVDEIYKNLLEDWQREKRKAVAEMKQKHVKKGSIAVVNVLSSTHFLPNKTSKSGYLKKFMSVLKETYTCLN